MKKGPHLMNKSPRRVSSDQVLTLAASSLQNFWLNWNMGTMFENRVCSCAIVSIIN